MMIMLALAVASRSQPSWQSQLAKTHSANAIAVTLAFISISLRLIIILLFNPIMLLSLLLFPPMLSPLHLPLCIFFKSYYSIIIVIIISANANAVRLAAFIIIGIIIIIIIIIIGIIQFGWSKSEFYLPIDPPPKLWWVKTICFKFLWNISVKIWRNCQKRDLSLRQRNT